MKVRANCVRAARDRIAGKLMGADLVVIVAGMGGDGRWGAPVVLKSPPKEGVGLSSGDRAI